MEHHNQLLRAERYIKPSELWMHTPRALPPTKSKEQNNIYAHEYTISTNLTVLLLTVLIVHHFNPLLWFKTRYSTPGPILGLHSSWRANCQWSWNSLSSLHTWFPGCLPFRSHWLMWQLWFWQCTWYWLGQVFICPIYSFRCIFLDSPLIIGNVIYYLWKSWYPEAELWNRIFVITHDGFVVCFVLFCFNAKMQEVELEPAQMLSLA